ncbi:uncharacterized protein IL334_004989 [Kwoniella shivajii]|uniref:Uncharacterized protein n=1 Tax=Kwoniella shivajii TaxID=564305 RepID=A0ABZ1D3T5_9TREE|nr:hypothetical protein IL334_004989 [Kwoniella shivajii]
MARPSVTLTAPPHSPSRSRSVSQPIPEDGSLDTLSPLPPTRASAYRSQSTNSVPRVNTSSGNTNYGHSTAPTYRKPQGRARSSSLVTVTEVGGDDPDNVVDRLGVGNNENADWVNAPDVSWTIVNLGYMAVSFLMFHHSTGVPFESTMTSAGAYDDLTLWEQIDSGAQYTPSKKWLTSLHRLRFHFAVSENDNIPTPLTSRPPSPFMDKPSKLSS